MRRTRTDRGGEAGKYGDRGEERDPSPERRGHARYSVRVTPLVVRDCSSSTANAKLCPVESRPHRATIWNTTSQERQVKYLCLIYIDETVLDAMPQAEWNRLVN